MILFNCHICNRPDFFQEKKKLEEEARTTDNNEDDDYEDFDFISEILGGGEPKWDEYRHCPGPVLIEHFNGSI